MTPPESDAHVPRRSFMARLSATALALGVAASAKASSAAAQVVSAPGPWTPTRHAQDDWLDAIPGQHRFFFDAASPRGAGEAITFASNFFVASKTGYGLNDRDNAVVVCLRQWATPFAFGDGAWAKFGGPIAERIQFVDPKTQTTPTINVYNTTGYGARLPNRETPFSALLQRGVHFAVCDMATRSLAGVIAAKLGLQSAGVYDELRASAVGNAHFVAAGIVAVNRAQERGYSLQAFT